MALKKYKLGDLISVSDEKNTNNKYTISDVKGISNQKMFIETKADMTGVSLTPYLLVKPDYFAYVPTTSRNGNKITITYNSTNNTYIVSSSYIIFYVKDKTILLSDYLFMYFNRPEFDRYARFNSWGSARETFDWSEMCDIDIELPSIEIQQKYVNVYKAMVANQKAYEKGLDDLKLVCDAYIENLKKTTPLIPICNVCHISDKRNNDEKINLVKGLTVYKQFIDTKADMDGVSLKNYKIAEIGDIGYVPTTNRNGDKLACGLAEEQCIVSSTYQVLKVDSDKCNPYYLFMWFRRPEMDRYARYNSWGSAREVIEWKDLGEYKIPVPPLEIQNSIANIYKVFWKRTQINEKLKSQIKDLCPILIAGAVQEAKKEV